MQRPAVHDPSRNGIPSDVHVSTRQVFASHFGGISLDGRPRQLQQSLQTSQSAGSLHSATAGPVMPEEALAVAALLEEVAPLALLVVDEELLSALEDEVAPPAPPSLLEEEPHAVSATSEKTNENDDQPGEKRMRHCGATSAPR